MQSSSLNCLVIIFAIGCLNVDINGTDAQIVTIYPSFNPYIITTDSRSETLTCSIQNTYLVVSQYIWYHNGTQVQSGKSVFTMEPVDLTVNGNYTCLIVTKAGNNSATIQIDVQYGPVVKTLLQQNPTEGGNLDFMCEAISNPSSTIYWTRSKDSNFRQNGPRLKIDNIQRSLDDIYTCHAENTLKPSRQNPVKKSDSKNMVVSVRYIPETVFQPSNNPFITYEGQTNVVIQCEVTASNPRIDSIKWLKNNSTELSNSKTLSISTIKKSDAGKYTCVAKNTVGISSKILTITVQYAPQITPISKKTVNEGAPIDITCRGDASPPVEKYWWVLPGGGVQDSARLQLNPSKRSQSGTYKCYARNRLTPSSQSSLSKTAYYDVNVDVQYGPGKNIDLSPSTKIYTITEGSALISVQCSAACNPTCSFIWTTPVKTVNKRVLPADTIAKRKAGNYSCIASNSVGSSTLSFSVIVNYKPIISRVSIRKSSVMENTEAILKCVVNSVPMSNITITFNGSQLHERTSTSLVEYKLSNTSCLQTGYYFCKAKNIVSETSRRAFLNVDCSPQLDVRLHQSKMVFIRSDATTKTLSVSVQMIVNPEPYVTLTFRDTFGSYIPISNMENDIIIQGTFVAPVYTARFIKYNFTSANDGEYIVTFRNRYGRSIFTVVTMDKIAVDKTSLVEPIVGGSLAAIAVVVVIVLILLIRRNKLCFRDNTFKHLKGICCNRKENPSKEDDVMYANQRFEETINDIKNNRTIRVNEEQEEKYDADSPITDNSELYQNLRISAEARQYERNNRKDESEIDVTESEGKYAMYTNLDVSKEAQIYQDLSAESRPILVPKQITVGNSKEKIALKPNKNTMNGQKQKATGRNAQKQKRSSTFDTTGGTQRKQKTMGGTSSNTSTVTIGPTVKTKIGTNIQETINNLTKDTVNQ